MFRTKNKCFTCSVLYLDEPRARVPRPTKVRRKEILWNSMNRKCIVDRIIRVCNVIRVPGQCTFLTSSICITLQSFRHKFGQNIWNLWIFRQFCVYSLSLSELSIIVITTWSKDLQFLQFLQFWMYIDFIVWKSIWTIRCVQ